VVSNQCEYLWQKRGVYYFRRKMPNDVQKHYERPQIVICLKTKSKSAAVKASRSFELRLGSPDFGFEDLTYREVCGRYYDVYLPKDEPVTLSQFPEIYPDRGLTPKMLDKEADLMDYIDAWGRNDANKAKAY